MRKEKFERPAFSAMVSPARNSLFGIRLSTPVFDTPDEGNKSGGDDAAKAAADAEAAKVAAKKAADDKKSDDDNDKKVSDAEAELLRENMKKKDTIRDLQAQLGVANDSLKAFDGLDADAAKTALREKGDAETKDLERKGEWDRLKERMAGEHSTEIKAKDDRIAELEAFGVNQEGSIQKLTIGHNFDNSKFINEEMVLTPAKARVIYGGHFDVEDGSVVAYDKPKGSTERTKIVDSSGNPIGFNEAIQKLVLADPDHETLIKSKMKAGANSDTNDGKASHKQGDMTSLEKIQASMPDLMKEVKKTGGM